MPDGDAILTAPDERPQTEGSAPHPRTTLPKVNPGVGLTAAR